MKPLTFMIFAFMLFLSSGCSGSGGGNVIEDTLEQLKKEGIGFDKDTFLDLFRFFLQLKKDYQSITLLPQDFRTRCLETYCKIRKLQIGTKDPKDLSSITTKKT